MRAGFGKSEIKFPEEMLPIEGFSGINDYPFTRVMYLEGDGDAMALAVIELVNVPADEITYAREEMSKVFDIPLEKTLVHMTHAITTPHEPGKVRLPFGPKTDDERIVQQKAMFRDALRASVTDAVTLAADDITEALSGWNRGKCYANQNRDIETPFGWWIGSGGAGPSDKEMQVLRVEDHEGKLKGVFVNYGLKPSCADNSGMMDWSRRISSDCCGMACLQAEQEFSVPVIYTVGAAGDQMPLKTSLAEEITSDGRIEYHDEGSEAGICYSHEIANILSGSIVQIANGTICNEDKSPAGWDYIEFEWQGRKTGRQRRLMKNPENEEDGSMRKYKAELFRLGNAVFIANRTETTAATGLEIKAASPFDHTVIMCMTNGEAKYLADRRSAELGTWEAQSSMYMPGCAEKFVSLAAASMNVLQTSTEVSDHWIP